MGVGRYIPQLIKIQIIYQREDEQMPNAGRVKNCVKFAFFNLSLTGPVKFIDKKNILAFDFTQLQIKILGWAAYNGALRGGQGQAKQFFTQKLKDQAFFTYFLVEDQYLAARGRGGGLALWVRSSDTP